MRHRRVQCGRSVFDWPWWCRRHVDHDGPCDLLKRPWKYRR